MKKYFAILASLMMLSACAVVDVQKDDEMDDTLQEEGVEDDRGVMNKQDANREEEADETERAGNSFILDGTRSTDDGTVNGKTTEDAGGDGQGGANVNVEGAMEAEVQAPRVIKVTADTWVFSPATITAKKGEKVTLQITAVNGTHGFAVPDLGINAAVAAGQTTTVTLPTDRAGTFGGFCSIPCGSGHKDMRVTVVISE